jgi:hypothetical protein
LFALVHVCVSVCDHVNILFLVHLRGQSVLCFVSSSCVCVVYVMQVIKHTYVHASGD